MSAKASAPAENELRNDIDKLLAPISVEHPSGEWLRYADVYDRIVDARREEDPELPLGVWQRELKKADWREVVDLCLDVIETRSKDLQLTVWLLEAWLQLSGIPGLEQGLKLLLRLSESFWDDIHPQMADGNVEARTAPFRYLNQKGGARLGAVVMTAPETEDAGRFTWADWSAALYLANLAQTDPQSAAAAEERGRVTQDKFLVSVSLTRSTFYFEIADGIERSLEVLSELSSYLDGQLGPDAPSFGELRQQLESMQAFVAGVLKDRMAEEGVADESLDRRPPGMQTAAGGDDAGARFASGPITSRAEAYRRLWEAAEFLQRVEPHSPAPYLVKRAVAWGGMPLAQLLEELLAENGDLKTINKLLGINE